jgi:ethanolamine utilization protein EutA
MLRSVGLDVGTTTTQLIVSELGIENRSGAFSVPEMAIVSRHILYESPVYFTPLTDTDRVDGDAIRQIVEAEYEKAGIRRQEVDTGAIIITGETSRKENARTVLSALSEHAGDFVVATAGPSLESILAARGAGAVAFSRQTGKTVLHMDIGGGTSNLALIKEGKILATGCLNVGGRLIKQEGGTVRYVSPVLKDLTDLKVGSPVDPMQIGSLANQLSSALEMAAGLTQATALLEQLWTAEGQEETAGNIHPAMQFVQSIPRDTPPVISFSGGVADCIDQPQPAGKFGDIGPELGRAIRSSRLCKGEYMLGEQTIRATVIGAGCHSAQLSGSTVYHRNISFPLKNLPVITLSSEEVAGTQAAQLIRSRYAAQDVPPVLALPGLAAPSYAEITGLARMLSRVIPPGPVYVITRTDMAKALGQALALCLEQDRPLLCLDRLGPEDGSFLDVAAPVGPALPVVIKTLILSSN